jgi:glutamate decarboxylase
MVFLSNAIADSKLTGSDEYEGEASEAVYSTTVYGSRWSDQAIPRFELPEDEMPPQVAYKLIKDDLALDSKPTLNLASFVTTYMEEEAEKLMAENISKNFIDFEEYPMSVEIQNRCVNIIARLFHAPVDNPNQEAMGVSTVGSSEAIMLAVLAMKRRWREQRRAQGLSTDKPNLIMGSNVQVCWEKACRYFDVEEKYVYCSEGQYILSPKKAVELVDENTIGVCVILGSTYTGHYEDVKAVNDLLLAKKSAYWFGGPYPCRCSIGWICSTICEA